VLCVEGKSGVACDEPDKQTDQCHQNGKKTHKNSAKIYKSYLGGVLLCRLYRWLGSVYKKPVFYF
jgi:hypothetical protein